MVQGQRVKGQGHSVCNRQRRFTAKSVGLSYLFNLSGGRDHDHVGCQAGVHKTSENNIFKPQKREKHRASGAMSFGLRDTTLSSWVMVCYDLMSA